MRIIAGRWGGRRIAEPKGTKVTRPTTDRVREAMASMIISARQVTNDAFENTLEGVRVLDAFAGSGALGMEMLSRGASFVQFCDRNKGAAQLVRKNLRDLGARPSEAHVAILDTFERAQTGRIPGGPFDVVLLDPPYAFGPDPVEELLVHLSTYGMLSDGALVIFEHAAADCGVNPPQFSTIRQKRYGIIAVDLLRYESMVLTEREDNV